MLNFEFMYEQFIPPLPLISIFIYFAVFRESQIFLIFIHTIFHLFVTKNVFASPPRVSYTFSAVLLFRTLNESTATLTYTRIYKAASSNEIMSPAMKATDKSA